MRQPSLFDSPPPEKDMAEAQHRLRRAVMKMLMIARQAEVMPWQEPNLTFKQEDFARYSAELPAEERDSLRAQFAAELARLRKVMAERAA
jgi:hypothetical protein